jgi:hypothetical protein
MKSKNQSESFKFQRKDGKLYSPYNNGLANKQHQIYKRRNKIKVALATGAAVVGVGGGVGIGYAIGLHQNNPPTPAPTVVKTLDIKGAHDLAVPYKNTYKYECKNGTLSVDGVLPTGFKFENDTLTFSGNAPTTSGFFKLKATANDGTGKTKTITITYYGVSSIGENKCRFLYSDGRVSDEQDLTISDAGTLTLSPSGDEQKILKAVYFGELSGVTTIGDNFLINCAALTTVDLSPLVNVTAIGD